MELNLTHLFRLLAQIHHMKNGKTVILQSNTTFIKYNFSRFKSNIQLLALPSEPINSDFFYLLPSSSSINIFLTQVKFQLFHLMQPNPIKFGFPTKYSSLHLLRDEFYRRSMIAVANISCSSRVFEETFILMSLDRRTLMLNAR